MTFLPDEKSRGNEQTILGPHSHVLCSRIAGRRGTCGKRKEQMMGERKWNEHT